jgi:hypothetical protein
MLRSEHCSRRPEVFAQSSFGPEATSSSVAIQPFGLADHPFRIGGVRSEFQPRLKSDHAWTAISTQADA